MRGAERYAFAAGRKMQSIPVQISQAVSTRKPTSAAESEESGIERNDGRQALDEAEEQDEAADQPDGRDPASETRMRRCPRATPISQKAVSDWPIASPIPTPANWCRVVNVASIAVRVPASLALATQLAARPGTA